LFGIGYEQQVAYALVDDDDAKLFCKDDPVVVIGESAKHLRCLCKFSENKKWVHGEKLAKKFELVNQILFKHN
jgi:hypothetical protein